MSLRYVTSVVLSHYLKIPPAASTVMSVGSITLKTIGVNSISKRKPL
jgi:hypothetical protein